MILRRLATSIRKQDWFAVVIETLIVVLGVFLGLQVNNWNEAQKLEVQKSAAIERLHAEAEASVAYYANILEGFEARNAARTDALRYLNADALPQDIDRIDGDSFLSIGAAPTVSPPRSVYDELISTGLFADIGDAQMREVISGYYAEVSYLSGQTDYMRELSLRRPDITSFEGASAFFDETRFRQQRVEFDMETLRENPEFMDFLLDGHSGQLAMATYWRSISEQAEAMCIELARISGRPCGPLAASEGAEQ